jgi:hypothetical protein
LVVLGACEGANSDTTDPADTEDADTSGDVDTDDTDPDTGDTDPDTGDTDSDTDSDTEVERTRYRLGNHPGNPYAHPAADGLGAVAYGLRLDGLFTGAIDEVVVFDFEAGSGVFLELDPAAGTGRLFGELVGGALSGDPVSCLALDCEVVDPRSYALDLELSQVQADGDGWVVAAQAGEVGSLVEAQGQSWSLALAGDGLALTTAVSRGYLGRSGHGPVDLDAEGLVYGRDLGFTWIADGGACDGGACENGGACVETEDGAECACVGGYHGEQCELLGECRCGENETCAEGSAACVCAPGFERDPSTGDCRDIDECAADPCAASPCAAAPCAASPCAAAPCAASGGTCVNGEGSFDCAYDGCGDTCSIPAYCAPDGTCGHPLSCAPPNELGDRFCLCTAAGYEEGPGGGCYDIDECARRIAFVPAHASCINTAGSYEVRCPSGTALNPSGTACVDLDECANDLDDCVAPRECANMWPGFACVCANGFTGEACDVDPQAGCPGREAVQQALDTATAQAAIAATQAGNAHENLRAVSHRYSQASEALHIARGIALTAAQDQTVSCERLAIAEVQAERWRGNIGSAAQFVEWAEVSAAAAATAADTAHAAVTFDTHCEPTSYAAQVHTLAATAASHAQDARGRASMAASHQADAQALAAVVEPLLTELRATYGPTCTP